MLTFNSNPDVGDRRTHGNDVWSWDGTKWVKHDRVVEKVEFYANNPLDVSNTEDPVTGEQTISYRFNSSSVKENVRLFEFNCVIKTYPPTGDRFYTFSPYHTTPDQVYVQLTRGMRYVITQPEDEFETNPLIFYEDKSSLIAFKRDPSIYEYTDGIIREKNVMTFRPKDSAPSTILYGVEGDTLMGRIHIVGKYN